MRITLHSLSDLRSEDESTSHSLEVGTLEEQGLQDDQQEVRFDSTLMDLVDDDVLYAALDVGAR